VFDTHRDAVLQRPIRCLGTALGEWRQRGIPQSRFHEGLQLRIRDVLVMDERADGALEAGVRESLNFLGCAAESGVRQQMRGAIVVPVGSRDGRQVVLPRRRPGSPALHRALRAHERNKSMVLNLCASTFAESAPIQSTSVAYTWRKSVVFS